MSENQHKVKRNNEGLETKREGERDREREREIEMKIHLNVYVGAASTYITMKDETRKRTNFK